MLGGWVQERASSLARLDRFDLSRLCVDNVVFTAGDTPSSDAGDTCGKFADSRRSECTSNSNYDLKVVLPPSVYSDTFLS